ncbi:MAG: SRPBCC family protein [Bacteroidetes bacterium]|nr:SRPBCC family protein [Bacteroidota bacterium]
MVHRFFLFFTAFIFFSVNAHQVQAQKAKLGKSPTETTVEVEINAPIEKVWAEFADIGNIYLNSPTVAKSHTSSEKKSGVGATRHMDLSPMIKKGASLDERVLIWEEGTYQKLEVYKVHKVSGIKTMGGDFRLIPKGDKTILRSTLNYSMKNGFFGMMNNMMGKKKFAKVWKSVILGYKHHIETGNEVTHETKLDLDAAKLLSIKKVQS